jgi:hypothetical protein
MSLLTTIVLIDKCEKSLFLKLCFLEYFKKIIINIIVCERLEMVFKSIYTYQYAFPNWVGCLYE